MDKCGIDMYKIMSSRHTYNTPLCWQTCRIKIDVFTVICYLDISLGTVYMIGWRRSVYLIWYVEERRGEGDVMLTWDTGTGLVMTPSPRTPLCFPDPPQTQIQFVQISDENYNWRFIRFLYRWRPHIYVNWWCKIHLITQSKRKFNSFMCILMKTWLWGIWNLKIFR